jgi:hypothetical protein
MPAVVEQGGKTFIDTAGESFDEDLLAFFEDYMAVSEDPDRLPGSRFALTEATGKGVAALLDTLGRIKTRSVAVKGQVTGPITFCTGVKDQDGRAIFYNETLRDAAVKHVWPSTPAGRFVPLSGPGCPVIIFIDEPALAGFGSSELISISKEEILACLQEVVDAIHTDGGLAGIHVCANTDWSLVLESGADIVNFDAYAYFDRFILYGDPIKDFLAAGGLLAWGIVPTLSLKRLARDRRYAVFPLAGAISPDRSPRHCSGDPFRPVLHHPQLRCRLSEPGPGQAGAGVNPGPVGNHS